MNSMSRGLSEILSDPARLEAIRRVALADTAAEIAFDRLTSLATRILNVPVSLVTLVEEDRQVFRGCVGLPEPWASARETPLSHSFCQHTLRTLEPLVIEDAREDPVLRDNLAIPDLHVVAYAGIPLVTSAGLALGSFCAIDTRPRRWTDEEIGILRDLAASVMSEIELREAAYAIETEQDRRLAILEATDQGIYGVDPELRCTFVNKAGALLLGYSVEELLGQNMHQLIHSFRPDGTPYSTEDCPICMTLRGGEGVRIEEDVLWRKDGSPLLVEYGAYPRMERGEVRGAVVIFQDITEWKRTQERAAAQHAVIRVLAESSSVREARPQILEAIGSHLGWSHGVMWQVQRNGRRLRRAAVWHDPSESKNPVQAVSGRITFQPGEGLPGRVWASGTPVWIPDVAKDTNFPRAEAAAREGLRGAFAFPIQNGSEIAGVLEFFTTKTVEPDRSLLEAMHSIGSSVGQFMERGRAVGLLRQSEERYRKLVELSPDALLVHRGGEILYANPSAATLFGAADPRELLGRSPLDLVHPDFRPLAERRVQQIRSTGESVPRIEEKFLRLDGETIHVEVAGNAIVWQGRRAVQVVLRDVSERKHAEAERIRLYEEARAAQMEAEAASQAKSQFLATMSHEIRTPVNAIVGYADLLELGAAGPITEKQRAHLERIKTSSEHLTVLIDDVLDLAKVEAGRITVEQETARAGGVVRMALDLIAPQAVARRIAVRNACGGEGVEYVGDEDRVRQILVNLLSNAVKFTGPGGQITVSCGTAEEAEDGAEPPTQGPWTCIRVEDTGIGIAPEQARRIFLPFEQAEMGHTRRHGGTGLGLAISRELARLMGGDITLRSKPGEGSAFTLWLPRHIAATPAVEASISLGGLSASALEETGIHLADAVVEILEAYALRLREDPDVPQARGMENADLLDHLPTLLSDVARSLIGAGGSRLGPERLLQDGSDIQRLIAELHGVSDYRSDGVRRRSSASSGSCAKRWRGCSATGADGLTLEGWKLPWTSFGGQSGSALAASINRLKACGTEPTGFQTGEKRALTWVDLPWTFSPFASRAVLMRLRSGLTAGRCALVHMSVEATPSLRIDPPPPSAASNRDAHPDRRA